MPMAVGGVSPFWSIHSASISTMELIGPFNMKDVPAVGVLELRICHIDEAESLGGVTETDATLVAPTEVSLNTLGLLPSCPEEELLLNSIETVTGTRSAAGDPHMETR